MSLYLTIDTTNYECKRSLHENMKRQEASKWVLVRMKWCFDDTELYSSVQLVKKDYRVLQENDKTWEDENVLMVNQELININA